MPRGRIRASGETGMSIANRVAISETEAKENVAWCDFVGSPSRDYVSSNAEQPIRLHRDS